MSAEDKREHLTATIWKVLSHYTATPLVHHADMIHIAAEQYAAELARDMADEEVGPLRLELAAAEYGGRR